MIREYTLNDYNPINVIGRDINMNYKLTLSNASKCFVYELDDEVVGFVVVDILTDRAEIVDIGVLLLHRNKKIGDKLLKYALEYAKNNGCTSVTLEVRTDNSFAIKMYKNNGFKTVNIRKKYYSNGSVDAYLMQKVLE